MAAPSPRNHGFSRLITIVGIFSQMDIWTFSFYLLPNTLSSQSTTIDSYLL
jgi:hypothetical protein